MKRTRGSVFTAGLVLGASTLLLISGCAAGGGSEEASTTTPGIHSGSNNQEEVATPGTDKPIKLPNDFPKNLPQYPGSAITEALTSEVGSTLIMTSSDSQEKIMAYYLKELPKLGWTMGSREGDYVASEFLDAFHSNDLDGTIGTDTDNNGTTSISLSTIVI